MKQLLCGLLLLCAPFLQAQQVGSKVIMQDGNGAWYTGTVKEITGGKYRVVYDNTDFDAWLQAGQFTVTSNPATFTSYKTGTTQTTQQAAATPQRTGTTQGTTTQTDATARRSTGNVPTVADIQDRVRKVWERKKTSFEPLVTVTFNDIKIGISEKANLRNEYDGIPKGATVTSAKIDFTASTHYDSGPKHVRRIMTALVYRDKFGEREVMNSGTVYPQE